MDYAISRKGTRLSVRSQKLLKAIHIYFACIWGGAAASLFAIHCLFTPETGPELYTRNISLIYIDNYVIIPAAIGCLLTGLIHSHMTKWGYVKYRWIVVKWVVTIVFLSLGFFWFVPWLNQMAESSLAFRSEGTIKPSDHALMSLHMLIATGQSILVLLLVIISVMKPWGKNRFCK